MAKGSKAQVCYRCGKPIQEAWYEGSYQQRCQCDYPWDPRPRSPGYYPEERRWKMVLAEIQAGKDFNTALAEGVENLKSLPGLANTSAEHRYGFARWCLANELNPWKKECFLIVRAGTPTYQIAYEILLQRAEGTEGYSGFKSGIIVRDRESKEVSYPEGSFYLDEDQQLVGAWCEPSREGRVLARTTVTLKEFMQYNSDGKPQARWGTAPASQILKCAVAEAHRRGFQPARREDVRFDAAEAHITEEEPEALPAPQEDPAAGLYEESSAAPVRVDKSTGEILEPPQHSTQPTGARIQATEPDKPTLGEPKGFANLGDLLNYYRSQFGMDRHQVEEVTGPLLKTSDLQEAQAKLKAALEPPPEDRDDQQVATRDRDESRQGG